MTSLHNMSVEQIIADIETLRIEGDQRIKDICTRLYELERRGQKHKLHTHRIYRHYERIALGKVLPGLVAMWSGDKWYIGRFAGLPANTQRAILNGLDISVAELNKDRKIVERRKPVARMSRKTIARLFPEGGGVATFTEQKAVLQKELEAQGPPVRRVRGDRESKSLYVGAAKVSLSELREALADMDLRLVPGESWEENSAMTH